MTTRRERRERDALRCDACDETHVAEDGEFNGNAPLDEHDRALIDAAWEHHKAAIPVATVIDENQPGRRAIIEIDCDPPTLSVGTRLYRAPPPFKSPPAPVVTEEAVEEAAEKIVGAWMGLILKDLSPAGQEYWLGAARDILTAAVPLMRTAPAVVKCERAGGAEQGNRDRERGNEIPLVTPLIEPVQDLHELMVHLRTLDADTFDIAPLTCNDTIEEAISALTSMQRERAAYRLALIDIRDAWTARARLPDEDGVQVLKDIAREALR